MKHISIDFVNLLGEICYTIDISLLNTQYGVFISYINDECLVDAFAKCSNNELPEVVLKEFVGHTPLQVITGIILGIFCALGMHFIVFT